MDKKMNSLKYSTDTSTCIGNKYFLKWSYFRCIFGIEKTHRS